ncbi:hypothetical protein L596_000734 [Steinernema carpocapsae]|uniref:Uncharacterized protein n=1 Tax=Steinernema carpocapsae TaxID=34508 RepID=A0A4U8UJM9_STECR|nr:hypothetical protein L596_000734 [Steinernema carpocapsae]
MLVQSPISMENIVEDQITSRIKAEQGFVKLFVRACQLALHVLVVHGFPRPPENEEIREQARTFDVFPLIQASLFKHHPIPQQGKLRTLQRHHDSDLTRNSRLSAAVI